MKQFRREPWHLDGILMCSSHLPWKQTPSWGRIVYIWLWVVRWLNAVFWFFSLSGTISSRSRTLWTRLILHVNHTPTNMLHLTIIWVVSVALFVCYLLGRLWTSILKESRKFIILYNVRICLSVPNLLHGFTHDDHHTIRWQSVWTRESQRGNPIGKALVRKIQVAAMIACRNNHMVLWYRYTSRPYGITS